MKFYWPFVRKKQPQTVEPNRSPMLPSDPYLLTYWHTLEKMGAKEASEGNFEKAIELFRYSIRNGNPYGHVLYKMGVCYFQLGQFENALESWRTMHPAVFEYSEMQLKKLEVYELLKGTRTVRLHDGILSNGKVPRLPLSDIDYGRLKIYRQHFERTRFIGFSALGKYMVENYYSGCQFKSSVFKDCTLDGNMFTHSIFDSVEFTRFKIVKKSRYEKTHVVFADCHLNELTFLECLIENFTFLKCRIRQVVFRDCNIKDLRMRELYGTGMVRFENCTFSDVITDAESMKVVGLSIQDVPGLVIQGFSEIRSPKYNKIFVDLVAALLRILERKHAPYFGKENNYNDFITDALRGHGHSVSDQTRTGRSLSGQDMGSPDIVIRESATGEITTIVESLVMDSCGAENRELADHIKKLLAYYDTSGNETNFLVVLSKAEDFQRFCYQYHEYVCVIDQKPFYGGPYALVGMADLASMVKRAELQVYKSMHRRNARTVELIHCVVNLAPNI